MFTFRRNLEAVRAAAHRAHGGARSAALLATALCVAAPAWADSLRCGRSLVSTGDTVAELREACGEPRATEPGTYQRFGLAQGKPVRVQRWRYRRAKGRYEGIVVVYRGEVVAIERGERR